MPLLSRVLAVVLAAVVIAPAIRAERLPLRAYTTADGLQRDEVWELHVDSQGYLWVLTAEGVSRFDGHAFTPVGDTRPGIKAHATAIAETRFGLLVAAFEGLLRAEPDMSPGADGRVRWVQALESPRRTIALHVDASGEVWCGTPTGLTRVRRRGSHLTLEDVPLPWPEEPMGRYVVLAIASEPDGTLWIGSSYAVFVRHPDGRAELVQLAGHPAPAGRAIVVDPQGRRWLGLSDGLVRLDPGWPAVPPVEFGPDQGLLENRIWGLGLTSEGELWAGTQYGLGVLEPGAERFRFSTLASGLPDDFGSDIAEDPAGNTWISTESGGVYVVRRNGFSSFDVADGLGHGRIAQLLDDRQGRLVAYTQGFASVRDGAGFRATWPNHGLPATRLSWGWQQVVVLDRDGRWWIATAAGLVRFPAVQAEQLATTRPDRIFTRADGLGADDVFRIFEDSRGDIWIAAFDDHGKVLTRWDRATDALVHEPLEPVRPRVIPTAFCEDGAGHLWIGFYDGTLLRTRWGREAEVIAVTGGPAGFVRDLMLDEKGRLWAGFARGGLARIDDPGAPSPAMTILGIAQGLSSDAANCFVRDERGGTWVGTGRGVDRIDDATGRMDHYGVGEGLANSYVSVAHRDRDGALWFGTLRGLSRYEPRPRRRIAVPPTSITALRVGTRPRPVSQLGERSVRLAMDHDERGLAVTFTAPWFVAETSLMFQRKLDQEPWSEPSLQREVLFDRLVPGAHRLLVRAVSPDGAEAGPEATLEIEVAPPVWRRWWFVAVVAAVVAGLIKIAHDWRVRRLLDIERVRTRIASDLHDDIGAGLTQVALLSEVARRGAGGAGDPRTDDALQRIAAVSRELVDSMSDIVWAVDPRRDSLADLIHRMRRFASDTFSARGIALVFEGPPDGQDIPLGADVRRQVYLIFKEAVNNAARHSSASQAVVRLRRSGDVLELEIEDDGVGFDEIADSTGHGLWNLQARAAALRGSLEVESAEGKGTRVRLTVPL